MNIRELAEFRLSDAVKFHSELNPVLFNGDHLDPEVRQQLIVIAEDFIDHLGVNDLDVKDITISGSNAAYTYTDHSDIDLHILVDIDKLSNNDIYRELFNSKKTIYNDDHNIKIRDYDVELYVQDANTVVKSLGEYSVLRDKWIKFPRRIAAQLDQYSTSEKFKRLIQLSELALRSQDSEPVDRVLSTIKKYRQAGLTEHGEFGPENLAYKALRSLGILDKLFNHRDKLHSQELSLIEMLDSLMDEDYSPDDPPGLKGDIDEARLFEEYQQFLEGASGYIPSNAEKDDPRFKTALTVDVKTDTLKKNAKKLGFKISRSGIPPLLR